MTTAMTMALVPLLEVATPTSNHLDVVDTLNKYNILYFSGKLKWDDNGQNPLYAVTLVDKKNNNTEKHEADEFHTAVNMAFRLLIHRRNDE